MRVPCANASRPPVQRVRKWALRGFAVASVAALVFVWCDGRDLVETWSRSVGHRRVDLKTPFVTALLRAPGHLLSRPAASTIAFDVRFEHILELRAQQQKALADGWISEESKSWVPAHVATVDGRQAGQLRLKGDLLDHLSGPKVSFRVRLRGDAHWQGLRHFSVQAPETKGFQLEALFHATVRHAGVLSPRYEFVTVGLNGDRIGVMAMEEHSARELLERSGRRDAVIVRIDEAALFVAQRQLGSVDPSVVVLDDYRTAPPSVFHAAEVDADETMRRYRRMGMSLLRGYVEGALAASEVFDVHELASYLAVCELWGSWHALRWHNLRFYLDPVRGTLAPIGFDGNLQMRRSVGNTVVGDEPLVARLLADPELAAAFRTRLTWLCREVVDGDLVARLAALEAEALPILQRDYVLLGGFDFDELRARARFHLDVTEAALLAPGILRPAFRPVQGFVVHERRLDLQNCTPWPALVHGLRWVSADKRVTEPVVVAAPLTWPLRLAGKPGRGPIPTVTLALTPPGPTTPFLEYEMELEGSPASRQRQIAFAQPLTAETPLVPVGTLADARAVLPALDLGRDGTTLRVARGQHRVARTLVVPAGFTLLLAAGAELRFARDAALVVHGPMRAEGVAMDPVVLGPDEGVEAWPGLAVLGSPGAVSSLTHVRIEDTRATAIGDWQLTGGVTFFGGRVALRDVTLRGTVAEDALNIIHAEVDLHRVHIEHTVSDAFDGDFITGSVRACTFADVAGDALDFSGSELRIDGCSASRVRDKALSVGEASAVTVNGLLADDVGAGVAVKDGSSLRAERVVVRGARVAGVMVYLKKPGYGGSRAEVVGLEFEGFVPASLCQTGSTLSIDGVAVATQPLDVEALYAGAMRKR